MTISDEFMNELEQEMELNKLRVVLHIDNSLIDYVKRQRFKHLECKGEAINLRGAKHEVSVFIVLDYDKKSAKEHNGELNECYHRPPMLCGFQNFLQLMQDKWLVMRLFGKPKTTNKE